MLSGSINQVLLNKLQNRHRHHLQVVSATPPVIKDIIVRQINSIDENSPPLGEFNEYSISSKNFSLQCSSSESEEELILRMMIYLEDLTFRAILIHIKENFQDPNVLLELVAVNLPKKSSTLPDEAEFYRSIKQILASGKFIPRILPDKVNHITRLSMNEFALYPHKKRGPLTLQGFTSLIKKIEKLAEFCPENLHLLFASIPVKTNEDCPYIKGNKYLHNMVIFVEGGSSAKISTFSKAIPASGDPTYNQTANREFNVSESKQYSACIAKPAALATSEALADFKGMNIHYGGNFQCQTAGGQLFYTAIDICLDHNFGVAKRLATNKIKLARSKNEEVLPDFASHIVISNSTWINRKHLLTETITHVDSLKPTAEYVLSGAVKINEPEFEQEIKMPAFGSQSNLKVYTGRGISFHINMLHKQIVSYNENFIFLKALSDYRYHRPIDFLIVQAEIEKHIRLTFITEVDSILAQTNFCVEVRELVINAQKKLKKENVTSNIILLTLMDLKEQVLEKMQEFNKAILIDTIEITQDSLIQTIKEYLNYIFINILLIEKNSLDEKVLFHLALLTNHIPLLKILIQENPAWVNDQYSDGYPIYLAVNSGQVDLIEFLIDQGAKITLKNTNKESILTAVYKKNPSLVLSQIIQKFTPLIAHEKDTKIKVATDLMFDFLVSRFKGCDAKNKNIIDTILKAHPSLIKHKDKQGNSLLHLAIKISNHTEVGNLLKSHADPALRNVDLESSYDLVVQSGDVGLLEDLYFLADKKIQFITDFIKVYIHPRQVSARLRRRSFSHSEYIDADYVKGIQRILSLVSNDLEQVAKLLSGQERKFLLEKNLTAPAYKTILKACSLRKIVEFIHEKRELIYFLEKIPLKYFQKFSFAMRHEILQRALKKVSEAPVVSLILIKQIDEVFIPHSKVTFLEVLDYKLSLLKNVIANLVSWQEPVFNISEIVAEISKALNLHPELLTNEDVQIRLLILLSKLSSKLDADIRMELIDKALTEFFHNKDFRSPLVIQSTCSLIEKLLVDTNNVDEGCIIKLIDNIPADVELKDAKSNTLLHISVLKNNVILTEYLLKRKHDLFIKNNLGESVCDLVASNQSTALFNIIYPYANDKIVFATDFINKFFSCYLPHISQIAETIANEIDRIILVLPLEIKSQILKYDIDKRIYKPILDSMLPHDISTILKESYYVMQYIICSMSHELFLSYSKESQLDFVKHLSEFLKTWSFCDYSFNSIFENKLDAIFIPLDFIDRNEMFIHKVKLLKNTLRPSHMIQWKKENDKAQAFLCILSSLLDCGELNLPQELQLDFLDSVNALFLYLPDKFEVLSDILSKVNFLKLEDPLVTAKYEIVIQSQAKVCLTRIKNEIAEGSDTNWHTFFRKKSISQGIAKDIVASISRAQAKSAWVVALDEVRALLKDTEEKHFPPRVSVFYNEINQKLSYKRLPR